MVLGFLSSFTDYAPGVLHPRFVGLRNYVAIFTSRDSLQSFENIGLIALFAVLTELAVGFAIAYLLRRPFRGRGVVRVLLLIPWLVSPVGAGVMWHFLYGTNTGLLNFWLTLLRAPILPSPLGQSVSAVVAVILVEVWRKAPLVSFLILPGLLTIPGELWEQSVIDGLPARTFIRHVVLPWLRPLLLTVALLLTGDALGTFDTVLMLTGGGPGAATLTPALFGYQHAFKAYDWPGGVTLAWVVVGAVLLLGLVYLTLMNVEAETRGRL